MFIIDNQTFNDIGLLNCTAIPEIRQRSTAGYSVQTGTRIQDIIGIFLNYSITIDFKKYDITTRNQLFDILTSNQEFHTFTLPHNGADRTFDGWFDGFEESLNKMVSTRQWGAITLSIKAKEKYQ